MSDVGTVTDGKTQDTFIFDKIGCTTNTSCAPNQTDLYAVNLYFDPPGQTLLTNTSCEVTSTDPSGLGGLSFENVYNRNGSSSTETFTISCITPTPSPIACPVVPTVIPKITCPTCVF